MMLDNRLEFAPVIIIGAGRSGTNVLRDTLCRLPGFATWDCDEINPIWRHGNLSVPHDEFGAAQARPAVVRFIRSRFARQWRRSGKPAFLVEKTCASSLRIPFIETVFPEARFIYLVRDGRDVVASAAKRWRGKLEVSGLPYYWAKARNTPMLDLPIYAWRFAVSRIGMMAGKRDRLSVWGPRFIGMDRLSEATPLHELCARQWAACVDACDDFLPEDRSFKIEYEAMTAQPAQTITDICRFLGAAVTPEAIAQAAAEISSKSVGIGRAALMRDGAGTMAILADTLARHDYKK